MKMFKMYSLPHILDPKVFAKKFQIKTDIRKIRPVSEFATKLSSDF